MPKKHTENINDGAAIRDGEEKVAAVGGEKEKTKKGEKTHRQGKYLPKDREPKKEIKQEGTGHQEALVTEVSG